MHPRCLFKWKNLVVFIFSLLHQQHRTKMLYYHLKNVSTFKIHNNNLPRAKHFIYGKNIEFTMHKPHSKKHNFFILENIVLFYNPIQWSIGERISKKALIVKLVTYRNYKISTSPQDAVNTNILDPIVSIYPLKFLSGRKSCSSNYHQQVVAKWLQMKKVKLLPSFKYWVIVDSLEYYLMRCNEHFFNEHT